jgi:hypothetical protein
MKRASYSSGGRRLRLKRNVNHELRRDSKLLLPGRCHQHIPGALRCLPFLMRWKGRKRSFSAMGDPALRM